MIPGGAQEEHVDATEILVPLVAEATVRIHGVEAGNPFLGSGFFVAPNWVLTCAHVVLAEGEEPVEAAARRVSVGYGEKLLKGVVEWAEPAARAVTGNWPAPDLALIRLLDHVDHPCVWLTERTAKAYSTNQVVYFGWVAGEGQVVPYNGHCTVSGQLGVGSGGILRLSNDDEMPQGMSGGPVVDLVRGEVIGVLKARRPARDGGLAVAIQQLRRLPADPGPAGDLYHRVMTAHDLHHADRHRLVPNHEFTWTDAHSEIGAATGRALTPGQRTHLLGMLAQLPPPAGTRGLLDVVTEVRGSPAQGLPLAPRAWRDGLGLLYDLRRGTVELEAVLRYAVLAAIADRADGAEEQVERALTDWARQTAAAAESLNRMFRNSLDTQSRARLRARRLISPVALSVPAGAAAAPRPRAEAQLEIIPRGWEPGRYDWRVCVVPENGEVDCVEEDFHGTGLADLPRRLAEPLAEAFRRCDEPGYVAALQLAVPGALVAFAADGWYLGTGARALGAARPMAVRRTDPPPDEDPDLAEERHGRWRTLHHRPPAPVVLDCDEAAENPVPAEEELRALPRETLPVLCRSGPAAPEALHRLTRSGYAVALWRREPVAAEHVCADFHRGTVRTVRDARTAAGLPGALARLRAAVADGVPEAYWSSGLTLLYDDPTRPLPGSDELLETP
ncbi:VMAP-C domain-containing protein [Streptomyces sp. NBC_00223]|uniref:VMAP-C domain-containing protein n=1 Tax=Streptomyces sp. NBC_00223 TaxID=2976008 RepID=UPI002E29883C|nr:trypsin-like peptidase domain-containing protein [Streptomyces sp. NBC_00223]